MVLIVLIVAVFSAVGGFLLGGVYERENDKYVKVYSEVFGKKLSEKLGDLGNFVGDTALVEFRYDLDLLEVTEEENENRVDKIRRFLWLKTKLSIDEVENLCRLKTHEGLKANCMETLDRGYQFLEKYSHYESEL